MLIQNDFLNHWKTRLLINRLGREAALVALLSLWSYCEKRRAWELRLSPLELAGLCDFAGDPKVLHYALLEFRFLDPTLDPSWVRVHDWGKTNASLVSRWIARHAKTHQWHPRGYITPNNDASIDTSIDGSIDRSIDPSIEPPIGLDWIGFDLIPPIAPQGGQTAPPPAGSSIAGESTLPLPEGEAPPGKKKKGRRAGNALAEAIYAAYPRKVGRDAALRAIGKRLFQGLDAQVLLDAVRNFAAAVAGWPHEDREFIPHPATWFNRGSFADDPREWQRGNSVPPGKFNGQKKKGEAARAGGERTWTQRQNERDQAQEDELDTLPRLPIDEAEPDWPWRAVSERLYGHAWSEWAQVPEDNRRELRAHQQGGKQP